MAAMRSAVKYMNGLKTQTICSDANNMLRRKHSDANTQTQKLRRTLRRKNSDANTSQDAKCAPGPSRIHLLMRGHIKLSSREGDETSMCHGKIDWWGESRACMHAGKDGFQIEQAVLNVSMQLWYRLRS